MKPVKPTVAESTEQGRAARAAVPRSSHGVYAPPAHREDPIGVLEAQAKARVPDLVPIRYGRMLASPFSFFRGAAAIMASDLAGTPRSGVEVQCCGDAHLANFGLFASPERRLMFDINDFDETLPGPWEWDVKRLVTSVLIAARERGFGARDQERIVLATAAEYRSWMGRFAAGRNLEVWYARVDVETLEPQLTAELDPTTRRQAGKLVAKARARDSLDALSKLTRVVDGVPRIISRPPLLAPIRELVAGEREPTLAALSDAVRAYRHSLQPDRRVLFDSYEVTDFARKVVGIGSVGTRSWIALLLGRDNRDPLFLQIKEAESSVLEPFVRASEYRNAGQRVVEGQRLMQAASDILLGWLASKVNIDGKPRDFYVRQLRDWKGSVDIAKTNSRALRSYSRLCAATLARAHARSGDRIAIASYLGAGPTFDRAMVAFSCAYADQNARDHAALSEAVASGRIPAETGI
ncbi:MAG: hypothetical protein QOH95_2116 [Gaiellaceae bacterium]|jgi:uncharacterized protein (DUF2252 family)|nr:hypothetical protein [Gaiellaceae bacterium]